MLFISTLFMLMLAGIFFLYGDGASKSPYHLAARALSFLSFCLSLGVIFTYPGTLLWVMGFLTAIASLAIFFKLILQSFYEL